MFCTNCGNQLKVDQNFCTKCGAPVEDLGQEKNYNPAGCGTANIGDYGTDACSTSASDDNGLDTTILAALQEAAKDPIAEFNKNPSVKLTSVDGRVLKTQKFPCIVGKGTIADVQISGNNAISREHIQLTFDDGKFFVADMNSSNYTYVNGEKLEPKEKHEISTGDTIKLADESFTVEVDV